MVTSWVFTAWNVSNLLAYLSPCEFFLSAHVKEIIVAASVCYNIRPAANGASTSEISVKNPVDRLSVRMFKQLPHLRLEAESADISGFFYFSVCPNNSFITVFTLNLSLTGLPGAHTHQAQCLSSYHPTPTPTQCRRSIGSRLATISDDRDFLWLTVTSCGLTLCDTLLLSGTGIKLSQAPAPSVDARWAF